MAATNLDVVQALIKVEQAVNAHPELRRRTLGLDHATNAWVRVDRDGYQVVIDVCALDRRKRHTEITTTSSHPTPDAAAEALIHDLDIWAKVVNS